ncbi:hypothetical protein FB567DRAFT_558582 [Paraphoma chrysanthemicola]|uniref:HMG box domain-containing protein n=1 Tax=Paraphoma chrysanthemicola TaxID=798071 RepID=A0A8K0RDA7_9PLEO|nr:hypothetical protein FB567DRAFT_558582 [Paraphoma chrysanthemicola]
MRSLSRLHGCAAAVILIILFFFWDEHSLSFGSTVHSPWRGTAHNLVVFGDDWSDTGNYRVSPPPPLSAEARDPDRGEIWTETLCKELNCDRIDNFARSSSQAQDNSTTGPVIDSGIYSQALAGSDSTQAISDLKAQVQEYLSYEKARYNIPQSLRATDKWTVFTVSFGLWDLLGFQDLDLEFAMLAIDNSISELFHQLELLTSNVSSPTKIVLSQMMEMTFLPCFQSMRNDTPDVFAEIEHKSNFLVAYWNTVLLRSAIEWEATDLFLLDPNAVVVDLVRGSQLNQGDRPDASGADGRTQLIEYVEQPCMDVLQDSTSGWQADVAEKCFDPSAHLFWDQLRLASTAQRLIGTQAASMIRSNLTIQHAMQGAFGDEQVGGQQESTNMPGDTSSNSPTDDGKPSRSLRKSSRIHDARSAPTSNPARRTKEEELPSPSVTSPRSSRTRLASLDEAINGDDFTETSSLVDNCSPRSAASAGSGDVSPHVCLCQPEPKIPRPRNAFILYRQHHQQAIIARNPGLNNPDISKIIGEQWKAEGEGAKKVWQDLALEEKARHQEQYPDYRYQPRRIGKPGSSPLNPSVQHTTVDKYRCPRCGGRSIKTPTSPFLNPAGTSTLPPPNYSEGLTPTTRYLPVMSNISIDSPIRRRGHGPSNLSNIHVPPIRDDSSMYSPLTPGAKKRRFDYGPPPPNVRRPEGPYYPQYARRDSLPPIQVRYSPPNSATMPPPRTPRDGRRPSLAEASAVSHHPDHSPRSVEELLGRISLPYKDSTPVSPALKVRGAIIAVEGDDTAAVRDLAQWLNDHLAREKDADLSYCPRIEESPKLPSDGDVTFEDYLNLIKEWHGRSKDMIKFITTPVDPPALSQDTIMSDKESEKDTPANRKDSASPPESAAHAATSPSPAPTPITKPIIILPTFQLAASVAYASRIPIQDAYSTTDHWQWMATLWRGTVGPDLTIYVKTHEKDAASTKPKMDDDNICLTVSKEREGKFAVADLRRVGFEVSEFIKGMGGKSA